MHPSSFDHKSRQARRHHQHRPTIDSNSYNINRDYDGDLGEGWNLQDAEEILRGRNYNLLANNPSSYPLGYPAPPSKEIPPPMFPSRPRHPVYLPMHGVIYGHGPPPQPSFILHPRPARRTPDDIVYGKTVSKRQTRGRTYNGQPAASESQHHPRQVISYNRPQRVNYHHLSGI
uniref:Uncharacterized protein n=2 Tax=Graphocephala atropunctata TaxID=36148 RepID=A0A1B6LC51_9HEMI